MLAHMCQKFGRYVPLTSVTVGIANQSNLKGHLIANATATKTRKRPSFRGEVDRSRRPVSVLRLLTVCLVIASQLLLLVPRADAAFASVSRSGVSATMSFTWTSHTSWNSGTMQVNDTSADSSSVYAHVKDNWGDQGSKKHCHAGNGNYCVFNNLYFTRGQGTTQYIYLRGCVDSIFGDECSTGSHVSNPFA